MKSYCYDLHISPSNFSTQWANHSQFAEEKCIKVEQMFAYETCKCYRHAGWTHTNKTKQQKF